MKLLLTSAYQEHSRLDRLLHLQKQDVHGEHEIAGNPAEADVIVFVENTQFEDILFERLLDHPLVHAYPEKVYMYNEMDRSWPMLPGLYCSLSAQLAAYSDHVAFPYINVCNENIRNIHKMNSERNWLYSFVGSASHPVRKPILSLQDQDALIVDTSDFCVWKPTQTSKFGYQQTFTNAMAESKFVLCPRGIGPSSLRLYETIEAGRVPVIISDSWVAPPQIDWSFAVRIPEWEIKSIPKRLREIEDEWQDRGAAARAAWESAYSPTELFNTFSNSVASISRTANLPIKSLRISSHRWQVFAEQEVRNWIKPPAGVTRPSAIAVAKSLAMHSGLGRLFSRKA